MKLVLLDPTLYLREYASVFNDAYPGVGLSEQHLSRLFENMGINRKKVVTLKFKLIGSLQQRQGSVIPH